MSTGHIVNASSLFTYTGDGRECGIWHKSIKWDQHYSSNKTRYEEALELPFKSIVIGEPNLWIR